ncbi:conjugative transposon protein TraN [Flavobacterium sp. FlaQc-48]|uniref:conjugative transposon protein TraN n=1 Tax=Flavobacterium sp. FlaQc-48 TaxID=3374181 RepID=UPI0037570409
MKNYSKIFCSLCLLIGTALPAAAQQYATPQLALGKIDPFSMQVTYDKTSHLIFPATIRYVDLGSENLIASKAEGSPNVLRVKASVRDFQPETNFSVITDEGHFYSFDVHYSELPEILSYDLQAMQKSADKNTAQDVLFEELGNTSPSLTGLLLKTIYKNDKRTIKHIASKSFGIEFLLKGLYIHNGKYYFHTQLVNQTNVPFGIDFMTFKVVDKKTARRTAMQERPLIPLRIYKHLDEIAAKSAEQHVFLLDQFTISDDKVVLIEIFEKNGGRHQAFELKNSDLVKAQLIKDLHLKF